MAPAAIGARGVKNKLLLPLIFKVSQNFKGDSLWADPRYCKLGKKGGLKCDFYPCPWQGVGSRRSLRPLPAQPFHDSMIFQLFYQKM